MRTPSPAALAATAVSFAVCGACSGSLVNSDFFWWLGIPFAILCVALSLPNASARARIAGVIGYAAMWPIAYFTAVYLSRWNQPLGICVGGIVGALGVTIVTLLIETASLSASRAESKSLPTAAAIGGIAALPLAFAFTPDSRNQHGLTLAGFAVWQAAVGTYIYFIARNRRS